VNDWQIVPLAAVLCGTPVMDARGALIGRVESVCTVDLSADARTGIVVRSGGVRGRAFFVARAQIACVAEDHVRLSVTEDEAIAAPRSSAGP
jgi:uncharacterized protein YrrD